MTKVIKLYPNDCLIEINKLKLENRILEEQLEHCINTHAIDLGDLDLIAEIITEKTEKEN